MSLISYIFDISFVMSEVLEGDRLCISFLELWYFKSAIYTGYEKSLSSRPSVGQLSIPTVVDCIVASKPNAC